MGSLPRGRASIVLAVMALMLGVAGCGADEAEVEQESPVRALLRFVEAAGSADAEAMWAELSTGTRARWGPTLDEFGRGVGIELAEGVGTFARSDYDVVVDEQVADDAAVAALAGDRVVEGTREYAAYAAALVLEDETWKLAFDGPSIVPLEPEPAARVTDAARARVRVAPAAGVGDARLWLDGSELEGVVRERDTIEAPLEGVERGRHVLVAYVSAGAEPAATAWTFTAG